MSLIVTCARRLEPEACKEIEGLLGRLGDEAARATPTPMPGIITAESALDPLLISGQLRAIMQDEPWVVRYCMRVIPIQKWAESIHDDIVSTAVKLASAGLPGGPKYRINAQKRHSQLSTRQLVSDIASKIDGTVSLEQPQTIVQIEVLGSRTGISVMPASCIISVEKEKRLPG